MKTDVEEVISNVINPPEKKYTVSESSFGSEEDKPYVDVVDAQKESAKIEILKIPDVEQKQNKWSDYINLFISKTKIKEVEIVEKMQN